MILSDDNRVSKYTLREDNKRLIYEGGNKDVCYSYERKTYGFGGTQSRIEKTCLYRDIDIGEYSDKLERNQQNNSDFIYEAIDEMPIFPGRTSKFMNQ